MYGMSYLLLALGVFAAATLATPSDEHWVVKESHPVPIGFSREEDAPGHHTVRLQIVLEQQRPEELEDRLAEIYDPTHPRYGRYMTADEVAHMTRPDKSTLVNVLEWLTDHGGLSADDIELNRRGNILAITTAVEKAEQLLNTTFGVYRHLDGTRLVRAPEWRIPEHLQHHIKTIQPTTSFIRRDGRVTAWRGGESQDLSLNALRQRSESSVPEHICNASAVTPLCLRTLYRTINYKPQVPGQNQIGLANYRNQVNNRSDIGLFLEKYRPEAASAAQDFRLVSVNGGTTQQTPLNETQLRILLGGEGDLDAEYLLALAWPTPLISWSTAGAPPFIPDADSKPYTEIEPYLTWLDYVLEQDDLPQVISNSYADDEQTVPPTYAHAVCAKFAELAARGVTVLTGSGDGGVGGVQPGGACLSNRDNQTQQFIPLFPSTCPYVTSVGGTVGFNPEVAAYDARYDFASGGGFSNYFLRPAFQDKAVSSYLATIGNDFDGLYNTSGRAYPDVAAYAVKFTQIWNGTQLIVDGTSASTPTMAAIISLANDALLAAGKPVLGWLNPWLYRHGGSKGFVDVLSGSAIGCNTTGFPATEGWDAVTGFGSPRFDKLLSAVGLDLSSCGGWRPSA